MSTPAALSRRALLLGSTALAALLAGRGVATAARPTLTVWKDAG